MGIDLEVYTKSRHRDKFPLNSKQRSLENDTVTKENELSKNNLEVDHLMKKESKLQESQDKKKKPMAKRRPYNSKRLSACTVKKVLGNIRSEHDITLLKSEHTHAGLFPSKHINYKLSDVDEEKSTLNETCPCCVGVLDLDEAAALAKASSASNESHGGLDKINPVPAGALGWATTILGGYFSFAGLYFGYINFTGTKDRLVKLGNMMKENEKNIDALKSNKGTKEEIRNAETYQKTMKYSVKDGLYVKWGEGAVPFVGSLGMMSSLLYSPISAPALMVMSGYALSHVVKFGIDFGRLNRVKLRKLDAMRDSYESQGKDVFLQRIKSKKNFYRSSMSGWGAYGVGAAVLGAAAIAALVGVTFPVSLLAIGAALLIAGVLSTLYLNNVLLREYAPKNQDRAKRQFMGNERDILSKLESNDKQAKLTKDYERSLEKNLKLHLAKEHRGLNIRRGLYYMGMLVTLGMPKLIRDLKHKNATLFTTLQQKPEIAIETVKLRNEYYLENMNEQLHYLKNIKENSQASNENAESLGKLDIGFIKRFEKFKNKQHDNLDLIKVEFLDYIEAEIKKIENIRKKLLNDKEHPTLENHCESSWDFLKQNGMSKTWMEKVFSSLEDKDLMKRFEEKGYILVEKNDANNIDENVAQPRQADTFLNAHATLQNQSSHPLYPYDPDAFLRSFGETCAILENNTEKNVVPEISKKITEQKHKQHGQLGDACCGGSLEPYEKITFKKEKFMEDLRQNIAEANQLMSILNEKLDHTIINDLKEEFEYQRAEICNHLEERLRNS